MVHLVKYLTYEVTLSTTRWNKCNGKLVGGVESVIHICIPNQKRP